MATKPNRTLNDLPPVFPVTRNDKGQLVHQTPEQLHPGMISGESDAAKFTRQVLAHGSQQLARLNAMWIRRDNRLKAEIGQYRGEGFDNARADTKAEIKRHEDALKERTGFKIDPAIRALVSGSFQQMTPAQRSQALDTLIAEVDGASLACLEGLSTVFTGLAPEQRATIKDRLFSAADPQTFAAWNMAKGNLERVERASRAMIGALGKFAASPDVAAVPDEAQSVASGFSAS
jgi:hypothetical protein